MIKAGLPGLLVYLFVLMYGLAIAWKKRDLSFAAFLFIIAITSVSENILDLNKGIFFYSFFFAYFLLVNKNQKPVNSSKLTGNQSRLSDD
jgi:hypothetical protein